MLRIILLLYVLVLILFSFGYDFFFFNEEFLVVCNLILFFCLLYVFLRKFIIKLFFFKIDHIYYLFLYLINLNIILANKIKGLLALFRVRSSLISLDFLVNFFDIININLVNLKSILVSNLMTSYLSNLYFNIRVKIYFFSSFKKVNLNLIKYSINFNKLILRSKEF